MKKRLYLITKTFPYPDGEAAFIAPELPYLKEAFDLAILPTENVGGAYQGAESVIEVENGWDIIGKLRSVLAFFCNRDAWRELRDILKSRHDILKQVYRGVMFGAAADNFYRGLKRQIGLCKKTDAIFYFYWADYKCFGLTMHKRRYPNIKIVARTHGYELYDERELYGRQFFKPQMDRELDRLVFVSEYGKKYYLDKYHKRDGAKYPLHCLGIVNHEWEAPVPAEGDAFVLVSCSNVIAIKRVELIIEGLHLVNESVKWIHIGDGALRPGLEEKAGKLLGNKKNISYEWLGEIPNDEVMEFYRSHPVNCFITTTATEGGNPVSIQEALSCGIPVIGTDVSDIPFMVQGNGIILGQNPTGEEVAQAIEAMCRMGWSDYLQWRKKAYDKYLKNYDADKLHPKMISDLQHCV